MPGEEQMTNYYENNKQSGFVEVLGRWDAGLLDITFSVHSVALNEDDTKCTLKGPSGELEMRLEGDCCSVTYFEKSSVDTLKSLGGKTITKIRVVDSKIPTSEEIDGWQTNKYGAIEITTKDGVETIDWRNESNGYYNGWCDFFFRENK